MVKDIKSILKKYLFILLLALLIRLVLMPFLFHPDIKTQYFHHNFLSQGIFDIYSHIEENKGSLPYKDTFNYPPLAYYFFGSWNFTINPLLGDSYQQWLSDWSESWFTNPNIFRHLFLLKIPYLLFDILTGIIIALIIEEKYRKKALIIWFFNPVNLYIIYGISNFDIIPTFLTILSVYFLTKKNLVFSGVSLGLAISFKIYPFLYLPFFLIYLLKNNTLKDIRKFLLAVAIPFVVTFLPFYGYLTGATNSGFSAKLLDLKIPLTPIPIFVALFLGSMIISLRKKISLDGLMFYILLANLLVFGVSRFHPQWLIWMMPFFVYFTARKTKLLLFSVPFLIGYLMSIINFNDRFITLGILSPILPNIYEVGLLEETLFSYVNLLTFQYLSKALILLGIILVVLMILKYREENSFNFSDKNLLRIFLVMDVFFIVTLLTVALYYNSDRILVSSQLKNIKTEDVFKDHDYVYKFKPSEDNLNLIFIQLKNPGFFNIDPFSIFIEEPNGRVLTELNYSGRNLGDGDFAKFQFPPLEDVKNKEIQIRLESPTIEKDKIIQVVTDDKGAMVHKFYAQGNFIDASTKAVTNFGSRFAQDKLFLIPYLSLIIIVFFYLIKTKKEYE